MDGTLLLGAVFVWCDRMYLVVQFFHFGSKSSSAGVLLRMAGLGWAIPLNLSAFFQKAKGCKLGGGGSLVRPSFPIREPEEAGDTPIHGGLGGQESRGAGEQARARRLLKDCDGTPRCGWGGGGRKQQMN